MTPVLIAVALLIIALAVLWRIRRDRRQRIADLVRLDRRLAELKSPRRNHDVRVSI